MRSTQLLTSMVRKRVRRAGWDINRYPGAEQGHRRALLLASLDVDLVVDVGANVGQYGSDLRLFGYRKQILSIEPMGAAYAELREQAHRDGRWAAIRSAIGQQTGEMTINISGNSVSSSLLPMLDRHANAAPESRYVGTETVPIARLDQVARNEVVAASRPFLKIDTQGYESVVLESADEIFSHFVGAELEMSLTPLYDGQVLMLETIDWMARHGLRLVGLSNGFWEPRTGETLQADGIFVRGDVR